MGWGQKEKEYQRQYRIRHAEHIRQAKQRYYQKHRRHLRALNVEYYKKYPEKWYEAGIKHREKLRYDVLSFYSNGQLCCKHCGNKDYRVLVVDHINNDAAKDRRKFRSSGTHLYIWLRKRKFPKGFQVLCHNCNFLKQLVRHISFRTRIRARNYAKLIVKK